MSVWPSVVAHLVSSLPTLPGWSGVMVFDGPAVTREDPMDFATVGFVPGEDFAGTVEQETFGLAGMLEETGSVRSEIVCQTGETDLPGMRARAFALFDAWQAAVRADQTLGGVLGVSGTASLSVDVQPAQTSAGAVQRLTVALNYFART